MYFSLSLLFSLWPHQYNDYKMCFGNGSIQFLGFQGRNISRAFKIVSLPPHPPPKKELGLIFKESN